MADVASEGEWPNEAIPIHEAAFEQPFSADNVRTLEAWLENFGLGGDGVLDVRRLDTDHMTLRSATINIIGRSFEFLWVSDKGGIVSINFSPPDSCGVMQAPDGLADLVKSHTDFVWEAMVESLNSIVSSGGAHVYARPRSPLAAPVKIPSDAWTHFSVIDWRTGVAECQASGDRLYSPHVVLDSGIEPRTLSSSAAAAWLKTEVETRERNGLPPMTVPEVVKAAARVGQSREWAREFRRKLPEASKLSPGEKKSDISKRATNLKPA
jgi:hypothetical protein